MVDDLSKILSRIGEVKDIFDVDELKEVIEGIQNVGKVPSFTAFVIVVRTIVSIVETGEPVFDDDLVVREENIYDLTSNKLGIGELFNNRC